jgi:hypothetical protein
MLPGHHGSFGAGSGTENFAHCRPEHFIWQAQTGIAVEKQPLKPLQT